MNCGVLIIILYFLMGKFSIKRNFIPRKNRGEKGRQHRYSEKPITAIDRNDPVVDCSMPARVV